MEGYRYPFGVDGRTKPLVALAFVILGDWRLSGPSGYAIGTSPRFPWCPGRYVLAVDPIPTLAADVPPTVGKSAAGHLTASDRPTYTTPDWMTAKPSRRTFAPLIG